MGNALNLTKNSPVTLRISGETLVAQHRWNASYHRLDQIEIGEESRTIVADGVTYRVYDHAIFNEIARANESTTSAASTGSSPIPTAEAQADRLNSLARLGETVAMLGSVLVVLGIVGGVAIAVQEDLFGDTPSLAVGVGYGLSAVVSGALTRLAGRFAQAWVDQQRKP